MDVTIHRTSTLNGWKLYNTHKGDMLRPSLTVSESEETKGEDEWE